MMNAKNILLTDSSDPLQRRLAGLYLLDTDAEIHFLLRGGEEASNHDASHEQDIKNLLINDDLFVQAGRNAGEVFERVHFVNGCLLDEGRESHESDAANLRGVEYDEIWHAGAHDDPAGESLQATRNLLKSLESGGSQTLNYITSANVASGEKVANGNEASATERAAGNGHAESRCAIETEIESAGRQGKLKFRIFSHSILVDAAGSLPRGRVDGFRRFFFSMLRFIEEIRDKSPDYFRHNELKLRLDPDAAIHFIDTGRTAQMLFDVAARPDTLNERFHIANHLLIPASDFFNALAGHLDVKIECVQEAEQLGPLDRMLELHVAPLVPVLRGRGATASEETSNHSRLHGKPLAHPEDAGGIAKELIDEYNRRKARDSRQVETAMHALEKGRVTLPDGEVLSYYVGGKGERTLVVINAYGQSLDYWERLVANLMENHRVVVWLPRSNEHTTVGLNRFSPTSIHAEDLNSLLIHLNVEKCDLLGWCTGPKLALEFYARNPQKVSTMIFLAGSFKNVDAWKSLETEYEGSLEPLFKMVNDMPHVAGMLSESLRAVLINQKTSSEALKANGAFADEQCRDVLSAVNSSLQSLVIQPFSSEQSVINYARQLLDFWSHDIMPLLPRVQAPVLLIGGEYDKIASPEMSREVALLIPQAKYFEVKGGSHYLHVEKFDLMTDIIEGFLTHPRDFHFRHNLIKEH